jgi:mono/diheme cytochrome c family protein
MRLFNYLFVAVMALASGAAALAQEPFYNLGKTPTPEAIRAWDIAISPEGKELPPGSGTAKEGAILFAQKCAVCHGPTGVETAGKFEHARLVGGIGTLNTSKPVWTAGSLYPYATTIWDFINRAMPKNQGGSLSANEVYALTAVILYWNGIIKENDVLDAKSLPKIQMPNRNGFAPSEPVWKSGEKRPFGLYPWVSP